MNELIKTWEKERLNLLELAEKYRETSSYNFYKLTHKALQLKYCIKALKEQLLIHIAVEPKGNLIKYCDSCEHETEHRVIENCLLCDRYI